MIGGIDEANAHLLETLEEELRKVPLALRFSCHQGRRAAGAESLQAGRGHGGHAHHPGAGCLGVSLLHSGDPLPNTIVVRGQDERFAGPQVVSDDLRGAREAVKYLLDLGHREIALLSEGLSRPADRLEQGYTEELASAGNPP